MKLIFAYCFLLALLMASCKDGGKSQNTTTMDGDHCYRYVLSFDTISLNIHVSGNKFNGTMDYKFFEKDNSHGTISGKVEGDKIIGDYKFSSEGSESVSEIIFLVNGDNLQVGFGEMEEKDNRFVYKDPENLKFDTFILSSVDCR